MNLERLSETLLAELEKKKLDAVSIIGAPYACAFNSGITESQKIIRDFLKQNLLKEKKNVSIN